MITWWIDRGRQLLLRISPDPETHIRLRMWLPTLLVGVLLVLTLLIPDRIWTTLLVGLSGLLAIAYVWTRLIASGLGGSRHLKYGWVSVGDRLEEEFIITNTGIAPALWVEIADESTVPGYDAGVVHSVPAHDRVRWRKSAVCSRRGRYRLGPWTLRSGDPFGLFEVSRRYVSAEEIIIHPPIMSELPVPLPPGRSEGRARNVRRSWQATINAAGVRDYQRLDPYNWIHWKTSARHDELYVRQFDRDATGDIWLIIDCDAEVQLGDGAEGTEEKAVLLAASLAARALSETRPVGLAVYGQEPLIVPPSHGQAQQWAILRALALMNADGTIALDRALRDLAEVARRGSAAVIITPTASPGWIPALATLEQRGIECHVLLFDRDSFGETDESGQSERLRRTIVAGGFQCQVLASDSIVRPSLDGEKHGYWEFKVTGTGKAVAVRRPFD